MTLQKTVYSITDKLFTYEIGTQYTGKSTKGVDKNKFGDLKNIFAAIPGKTFLKVITTKFCCFKIYFIFIIFTCELSSFV